MISDFDQVYPVQDVQDVQEGRAGEENVGGKMYSAGRQAQGQNGPM